MARLNTLSFIPPTLIAATFLVATCAVPSARAAEPPADLCSLLPAADVSKGLGRTYDSPQKSLAPRPFANTATGTDCKYPPQGATRGELWFRAYVDPSTPASADLFSKLSKFYGPQRRWLALEMKLILTRTMRSTSAKATYVSISI
jgi:hypothetical protein